MDRDTLDLCGFWRFQPDPYAEGDALGYLSEGLDTRLWREVRVPCGFDRCVPGLKTYEGPGWYHRDLLVPEGWRGKSALLRFEGINNRSRLWVNGHLVAESDLPWLPVEAEVSRYLRPGESNALTVWADSTRRPQDVPGRQRGWRTPGGILRECSLTATAPQWIDDLWVSAAPTPGGGGLVACVSARALSGVEGASVGLSVLAPDGAEALSLTSNSLPLRAGSETTWELSSSLEGAQPWSPEHPSLFQATATLYVAGREVDRQTRRFGFRRIQASEGGLHLNGSLLFLTGFNRHEDTPELGPLPDLVQTRRDLEAMKDAGCNFVRLCHYPHHPGELDLCDELGLLVMDEIPLYWWNGLQEGEEACGAKLDAALRQVKALIRRDRGHPSVIFWSVSNETSEASPEVSEGNARLVRLARELDPTRLAVHVSDKWPHTPHFEEDDCLCLNAYPSWGGRCWSANPAYDPAHSAEWWREEIEELKALYPGKPVVVTELGYPAIEGVAEGAVGEEMQAQVLEAELGALRPPLVSGVTVWCWADHPWPEEDFIRYMTTSPFGVVSRAGRPKPALADVSRAFREAQGITASRAPHPPNAEDLPVRMVRPHLHDVPQAPFPEGFGIRPMRRGEAALWTDVQRDTERLFTIGDDLFEREFGDDPEATTWRCFFVVDPRGTAVGTISAWYSRDVGGLDYGRIHWVAIRPAFQGRGLGKAALSHAMEVLARHHVRAWLDTSTARLPALRMYLDFGFLPDLGPAGARDAWTSIQPKLKHPALDAALSEEADR